MQIEDASQLPVFASQLSKLSQPKDLQRLTDQMAASRADEVAQEFEGIFTSMLLKQMRETLQEGLFPGDSGDVYGGLFDLFIGKHMAANSALGVDRMVREYLDSVPTGDAGSVGR